MALHHKEAAMPFRSVLIAAQIALVALLGAGSAWSQTPPAPPADSLAAAKELVTTMRATDQLRTIMPLIMQQLKPAIVQNRAEVAKDYDAMVPHMMEIMEGKLSQFADGVAVIYARHFAADELRQVTAFYQSPIGQKFLSNMPVITQESLAMGNKFGQEIAGELRNRMIDELRKKGHNI
jgi:hypothetical protein